MSVSFEIDALPRSDAGKGASRRLRRSGQVPAIIYGGHQDPAMISVVHTTLLQNLEYEAFYSHILTLKLAGKEERVVLKDLQRHPSKPFVQHVDFQRISENEKLRLHVPLHFVNEATSPGVKMGGRVSHTLADVEVSCLPKDLPEFIEVDMAVLEVGQSIHLSELQLPAGVEIPELAQGPEHDLVVVSIHAGHAEAETAEVEEGAGE